MTFEWDTPKEKKTENHRRENVRDDLDQQSM